jgi:hypothetical protein
MATPTMSADMLSEIATLSAKAVAGSISDDELRRGLKLLREDRLTIKPSKAAKLDGDAELASLLDL